MRNFLLGLCTTVIIGGMAMYVVKSDVVIADTNFSGCGTLSASNETYVLTQNIGTGSDCVTVNADNIVIDLGGFTIAGNIVGSGDSGAGRPNGYSFTVRNGVVNGDIISSGATGGNGASGAHGSNGNGGSAGVDDGMGTPADGGAGESGATGEEGQSGETGGSGGNITVINVTGVTSIVVNGGTGGIGGAGGSGGLGGNGADGVNGGQGGVGGAGGHGGRNGAGGMGGSGGAITITTSDVDSVSSLGGHGGAVEGAPGNGGAGGNGSSHPVAGGAGGNGGDGQNGGQGGVGGAITITNSIVDVAGFTGGNGGGPYGAASSGGAGGDTGGASGNPGAEGVGGSTGSNGSITVTDEAPNVVLVGDATMEIEVGEIYIELGATATDAKDGDLTPIITGSVNSAVEGIYVLTYTATDTGTSITVDGPTIEFQEPQSASTTRTITVVAEIEEEEEDEEEEDENDGGSRRNRSGGGESNSSNDSVSDNVTTVTVSFGGNDISLPIVRDPLLISVPVGGLEELTELGIEDTYVCEPYLRKNIVFGAIDNDSVEITKLQSYLAESEGEPLETNGIYDEKTRDAVNRFQLKYKDHILAPEGLIEATGNVGKVTRAKINAMICAKVFGCPYFTGYHVPGTTNDYVKRVKGFLNIAEPEFTLDTNTGLFDDETKEAVKGFQLTFKNKILAPHQLTEPNGNWFKDTRKMAHEFLGCTEY